MKMQTVEDKKDICEGRSKQQCFQKIFNSLSGEDLSELKSLTLSVEYKKGELIFQKGSIADGIYIVCNGFVLYGKHSDKSKRQGRIFKIVGPGEILGEETFFSQSPCSRFGYARVLADAKLSFLEKEDFLSFSKEHPELFFDLSKELVRSLTILENRLMRGVCNTIDQNLALLLLNGGKKYGIGKGSQIHIPLGLKQGILADILGVSVESVANALSKLKEMNVILVQSGDIVILDVDKLKELAKPSPLTKRRPSASQLI